MEKQLQKILVLGATGLAGSAVMRSSLAQEAELVGSNSQTNLLDEQAVHTLLSTVRPQVVVVAAAKVGGIVVQSWVTWFGNNTGTQRSPY